MKVIETEVIQSFLELDIADYSAASQQERGRARNKEILAKIGAKTDGDLSINSYSNLGITMRHLSLKLGSPKDYTRIVELGSNPSEYKIKKISNNDLYAYHRGGIKDMVNL